MGRRKFDVSAFKYDESSPTSVRWVENRYLNCYVLVYKDDPAGSIGPGGYYWTRVDGVDVPVHEIVWRLNAGEIPDGKEVDHKDRNKTNNKFSNLELKTRAENCRNKTKRVDNKTGKTGVTSDGTRYRVFWMENGKARSKSFSFRKFGEKAFELACEYRDNTIDRLNLLGYNYSPTHGL